MLRIRKRKNLGYWKIKKGNALQDKRNQSKSIGFKWWITLNDHKADNFIKSLTYYRIRISV